MKATEMQKPLLHHCRIDLSFVSMFLFLIVFSYNLLLDLSILLWVNEGGFLSCTWSPPRHCIFDGSFPLDLGGIVHHRWSQRCQDFVRFEKWDAEKWSLPGISGNDSSQQGFISDHILEKSDVNPGIVRKCDYYLLGHWFSFEFSSK